MEINQAGRDADVTEFGLGTLLRMPYQVMITETLEPALAAAGFGEIRSAHLPVIRALSSNPDGLRATELAMYARITKQSAGYLVDNLSAGGYVERVPDPTDQRAKMVRLTPRGWTAGRTILATVRGVEADWAQRIGAARITCLRQILQELVISLNAER
ncbi:MAG TPA: MarR family transcriptional regulator [Thermomicrobiales bacterium]|nr:MarR family transcriptional regulator [Thermomicrobiales bacterium]